MEYDTVLLANFRINFDYALCIADYYLAPLIHMSAYTEQMINLGLAPATVQPFHSESIAASLMATPSPNSYLVLAAAACKNIRRQAKAVLPPVCWAGAEELLDNFLVLYQAIEGLAVTEKSVIKYAMTRYQSKKLHKKFFQHVHIERSLQTSVETLRKTLTPDQVGLLIDSVEAVEPL